MEGRRCDQVKFKKRISSLHSISHSFNRLRLLFKPVELLQIDILK